MSGFDRTEIISIIEGYYESQLEKYLEATSDVDKAHYKGILMGYKSSLILLKAG